MAAASGAPTGILSGWFAKRTPSKRAQKAARTDQPREDESEEEERERERETDEPEREERRGPKVRRNLGPEMGDPPLRRDAPPRAARRGSGGGDPAGVAALRAEFQALSTSLLQSVQSLTSAVVPSVQKLAAEVAELKATCEREAAKAGAAAARDAVREGLESLESRWGAALEARLAQIPAAARPAAAAAPSAPAGGDGAGRDADEARPLGAEPQSWGSAGRYIAAAQTLPAMLCCKAVGRVAEGEDADAAAAELLRQAGVSGTCVSARFEMLGGSGRRALFFTLRDNAQREALFRSKRRLGSGEGGMGVFTSLDQQLTATQLRRRRALRDSPVFMAAHTAAREAGLPIMWVFGDCAIGDQWWTEERAQAAKGPAEGTAEGPAAPARWWKRAPAAAAGGAETRRPEPSVAPEAENPQPAETSEDLPPPPAEEGDADMTEAGAQPPQQAAAPASAPQQVPAPVGRSPPRAGTGQRAPKTRPVFQRIGNPSGSGGAPAGASEGATDRAADGAAAGAGGAVDAAVGGAVDGASGGAASGAVDGASGSGTGADDGTPWTEVVARGKRRAGGSTTRGSAGQQSRPASPCAGDGTARAADEAAGPGGAPAAAGQPAPDQGPGAA